MNAVTGWGRLVLVQARTGWRRLLVSWALCSGLVVATFAGVRDLYPGEQDRLGYAATLGASAATAAFNGRGYDLHTVGGIGAYEVGFTGQLLLPLVAALLAVGFVRAQEEAGVTELLTAHRVGRAAPLVAGAVLVGLCVAAVGLTIGGGLVALGLPAAGSWRYAAVLAAMAWAFAAVGLVAGELAQGARAARAVALGALGVAFAARVVVDGRAAEATWLSPLGWLAEARPWGQAPSARPVAAYLALVALGAGVALGLRLTRDLGSGVLAPRPGPARGRRGAATPIRWAWRTTRAVFVGWLVGAVLLDAAFGLLADEMVSLVEENPALLGAMGLDRATDLVASLVGVFAAALAAACGVGVLLRLREEEEQGRLALVLAGTPSRAAVWAGWLVVAAGQTLAVLGGALAAYGTAGLAVTGEAHDLGSAALMALAYGLPVLVVVGLAAALAAWLPPLTALAYAPAAWIAVVGLLGPTLRLPEWARDLSPVAAVGHLPREDPSGAALLVLGGLVALLVTTSLRRARRRDLRAG